MIYHLVKLCSRLLCLLPVRLQRSAGNLLGAACWPLVPPKRRRMAIENIMRSLAVDRPTAQRIAKASATRFGRMFTEVLCLPELKVDNIGRRVELSGKEHLEEALSYGRGAVIATAHAGNWELLGAALAMHGFPLIAVAQKQTNEQMDRFINEYRTMAGMHVTYKTGVREMIRMLGQGKIIGLLMDQHAGRDGVWVDFFGRQASTATGAAALARMKGAPIVPAFITEKPDGTHTVLLHPIVWPDKTEVKDEDIRQTTQRLTTIIEAHIRQYPQEWFWLHNRWKHSPDQ